MDISTITIKQIETAYSTLDYPLYKKGQYNLNIFGIRAHDSFSDTFNDAIGVYYKDKSNKTVMEIFPATTDPGLYYREKPINPNGTAILVPGYMPSAFTIGLHQGKYRALKQNVPLAVWRDNNKDGRLDMDEDVPIVKGFFGINIHRSTANEEGSKIVHKWSAGCQVFKDPDDFNRFMELVDYSAAKFGPVFSYALFTENQVIGE